MPAEPAPLPDRPIYHQRSVGAYFGSLFAHSWDESRVFWGTNRKQIVTQFAFLALGAHVWALVRGWEYALNEVLLGVAITAGAPFSAALVLYLWDVAKAPVQMHRRFVVPVLVDAPDIAIAPMGLYADTRKFNQRGYPVPKFLRERLGVSGPADFSTPVELSFLHLSIINEPHGVPTERSSARDMVARIRFFDSAGLELFSIDGRWSDTSRPTSLPSKRPAAEGPTTLAVGQIREVDIAMMYPGRSHAFAFNNDSYSHDHLCNQAWRLGHGDYVARVEIIAPYVRRAWNLKFNVGERLTAMGLESVAT